MSTSTPDKNRRNIAQHGVSLADATGFDFDSAMIREDDRFDYGEVRWFAIGFYGDRLFSLVFVEVDDDTIRTISLRSASRQEATLYVQHAP